MGAKSGANLQIGPRTRPNEANGGGRPPPLQPRPGGEIVIGDDDGRRLRPPQPWRPLAGRHAIRPGKPAKRLVAAAVLVGAVVAVLDAAVVVAADAVTCLLRGQLVRRGICFGLMVAYSAAGCIGQRPRPMRSATRLSLLRTSSFSLASSS